MKILVVEDEPGIAFALEADLQGEGYDVTVASTGDEGLRLAKGGSFDLVLLDVMLPGRDGFEVCRDLRRANVRTPIILLTARTHDAEKVLGLELGADDYVTKPYNPRELRARLRAVLRRTNPDDPTSSASASSKWISVAARSVVRARTWTSVPPSSSCSARSCAARGAC